MDADEVAEELADLKQDLVDAAASDDKWKTEVSGKRRSHLRAGQAEEGGGDKKKRPKTSPEGEGGGIKKKRKAEIPPPWALEPLKAAQKRLQDVSRQ